mmetsp:Transcript_66314/g.184715  ORF Transcript_66314/g.184715 Transcript_66314/m.184715 type:complete len:275 (+) Transcript_66314:1576-2400(+)
MHHVEGLVRRAPFGGGPFHCDEVLETWETATGEYFEASLENVHLHVVSAVRGWQTWVRRRLELLDLEVVSVMPVSNGVVPHQLFRRDGELFAKGAHDNHTHATSITRLLLLREEHLASPLPTIREFLVFLDEDVATITKPDEDGFNDATHPGPFGVRILRSRIHALARGTLQLDEARLMLQLLEQMLQRFRAANAPCLSTDSMFIEEVFQVKLARHPRRGLHVMRSGAAQLLISNNRCVNVGVAHGARHLQRFQLLRQGLTAKSQTHGCTVRRP